MTLSINNAEYVKASVELAHELAQLGKFERAASLYSSLRMKEFANVASYKVLLDLRFAEVMAISGNTTKRYFVFILAYDWILVERVVQRVSLRGGSTIVRNNHIQR